MVMGHRALAGNGFSNRNAMVEGKLSHHLFGTRIARAATGDDERTLGCLQELQGFGYALPVWPCARDLMHGLVEEPCGIVPRHFLNVLRQANEGRATIGRV